MQILAKFKEIKYYCQVDSFHKCSGGIALEKK